MWGIASALIVTFVFAMWNVPPFTATVPAWVFGALAAVLCPLGQLDIISVKAHDDYTLELVFENDEKRVREAARFLEEREQ